MNIITLPNSRKQLSTSEILDIEAIGAIEGIEFDHYAFSIYTKNPEEDKPFNEHYIVNISREAAQDDLMFLMTWHPKL